MAVADLVVLVSCKRDILLKSGLCATSSGQTLRDSVAALACVQTSPLPHFFSEGGGKSVHRLGCSHSK